jgi:NAD(P)-dependent dehydrogenase (short-subunit alcohol dehydrogenase family)
MEILIVTMDMAEEQTILSGMQLIIQTFGRIDYAVNNAGFGGTLGISTNISTTDFRKVLDVNMTGLWIAQREQIRQMMKQEPAEEGVSSNRGVIVNMSSMLGLVGTNYKTPAIGYSTR